MNGITRILAPDRARAASGKLRIFAGPRWVRPDDKTWRRIEDVVSIQQVATGGYRLTCGDRWIELRPDIGSSAALATATKRTIVDGRAFGPVLDAKAAPDSLVWRVTASAGVERREDLWLLGEPDGVALGLHLRDWRAKFGKRCIVDGDRITLDLTEAKKAGDEIDLDPRIDPVGGGVYYHERATGYAEAWAVCRAHADSTSASADAAEVTAAFCAGPGFSQCGRTALRFDTSAAGTPLTAVLKLHRTASTDPKTIHLSRAAFTGGTPALSPVGTYGECKDDGAGGGYDNTPVGNFTNIGDDYTSPELVAASAWANSATYDLAVCDSAYDVGGAAPGAHSVTFTGSGALGPHLDIEVVTAVPGGMMRMGMGR